MAAPRLIFFLINAFLLFALFTYFGYNFTILPRTTETRIKNVLNQQLRSERSVHEEKENILRQNVKKLQNEIEKNKEPAAPPEATIPPNIGVGDLCTLLNKGIQVNSWWKYVCMIERNIDKPLGYECKDLRNMGNWRVCFDEKYSPIRPNKPCLVYSFGIAFDFSFDDAMAAKGCEVYSFDPSMGLSDHTHGKNITFKNLGLSHVDDDNFSARFDIYVTKPQTWKIRTLRSVMKMLKHEKRVIDVLKFDIEIAEWEVMINIIEDGMLPQIRQLLTEWHIFPKAPARDRFKTYYEMHRDLPSHGLETFYRQGHSRFHSHVLQFRTQAESCYVNVKFTDPK